MWYQGPDFNYIPKRITESFSVWRIILQQFEYVCCFLFQELKYL